MRAPLILYAIALAAVAYIEGATALHVVAVRYRIARVRRLIRAGRK